MARCATRPGPARPVGRPRAPIWVFFGEWGGGLNREITVLDVQFSWCIRPQAFFIFFFSAFFFSTGIPTSSYFFSGVERSLEA